MPNRYWRFGTAATAPLDLVDIAQGYGGFLIASDDANEGAGYAIGAARDVNGDGLDDILIGAPLSHQMLTNSGTTYVVCGKTSGSIVLLGDIASCAGGFAVMATKTGDDAYGAFVAFGKSSTTSVSLSDVQNSAKTDFLAGRFCTPYDPPRPLWLRAVNRAIVRAFDPAGPCGLAVQGGQ